MWPKILILATLAVTLNAECVPSVTTARLSLAPTGPICSGDLLFEDNFDELKSASWKHSTVAGENFHDFVDSRKNSYTKNGILYLKATPNSEEDVANHKTRPVSAARISTQESFAFTYGRVEVGAQTPSADWIHSYISLDSTSFYGDYPRSGRIDLMKTLGNRKFFQGRRNIGSERFESALRFGPDSDHNGGGVTQQFITSPPDEGFDREFHTYEISWTPEKITFGVDGLVYKQFRAGEGFWKKGGFDLLEPPMQNIWENGTIMAPFDRMFYISLTLGVGGYGVFKDTATNHNGKKPWLNTDKEHGMETFWAGRQKWLHTWEGDRAAMQIDYVRIWAL